MEGLSIVHGSGIGSIVVDSGKCKVKSMVLNANLAFKTIDFTVHLLKTLVWSFGKSWGRFIQVGVFLRRYAVYLMGVCTMVIHCISMCFIQSRVNC